jgi:hypothetical protein
MLKVYEQFDEQRRVVIPVDRRSEVDMSMGRPMLAAPLLMRLRCGELPGMQILGMSKQRPDALRLRSYLEARFGQVASVDAILTAYLIINLRTIWVSQQIDISSSAHYLHIINTAHNAASPSTAKHVHRSLLDASPMKPSPLSPPFCPIQP